MHWHYMTPIRGTVLAGLGAFELGGSSLLRQPAAGFRPGRRSRTDQRSKRRTETGMKKRDTSGNAKEGAFLSRLDIPTFLPLPDVTNQWHSLSGECKYSMTEQYGVAVGYRYEKFCVKDFAAINLNDQKKIPRIDYLGGITIGYGSRSCRGRAAAFRIFRQF